MVATSFATHLASGQTLGVGVTALMVLDLSELMIHLQAVVVRAAVIEGNGDVFRVLITR